MLSSRFLIAAAVSLLGWAAYVGAVLYEGAHQTIEDQFGRYQVLAAHYAAHHIGIHLATGSEVIQKIARLDSVQRRDSVQMATEVQACLELRPELREGVVGVYSRTGELVWSLGGPAPKVQGLRQAGLLQWASREESRGQTWVSVWLREGIRAAGQPLEQRCLVATPLYASVQGRADGPSGPAWDGVLVLTLDVHRVVAAYSTFEGFGNLTRRLWIMDRDGTLLVQAEHPEMVAQSVRRVDDSCLQCHTSFDYARAMLTTRTGVTTYRLKDGPEKLAAFATMRSGNASWVVVVNTPAEAVTGFVRQGLRRAVLLIGMVAAAFILGVMVVYRAHRARAGALAELRQLREKHRLEEQATQAESRYRVLFAQSPYGLLIVDPQTTLPIEFNAAAHEQLGYTREEFARLRVTDYEVKETPEEIAAHVKSLLREGRGSFETQHRTKQGELRDVEITAEMIEWAGRPAFQGILRDVTEQKAAQAKLLRAQRLESLGILAGGIAHDLNNALAPTLMGLELLRDQPLSQDGRKLLDTMDQGVQRAKDMVRNMVVFSRGMEGKRAEVQPRHLIREIQQLASHTFPKTIEVRIDAPKETWLVLGNPTQLHQVLLNLCINARDAMPTGGKLTVGTRNARLDQLVVAMNPEAKEGAYVVISVADTGTGMTPEVRRRLFEPFFTTKDLGKGTGLGLSTSLDIVRNHGGFIQVKTEPGQGTAFEVYLPAAAGQAAAVVPALDTEAPRGQGELILVVDDETHVRTICQETLRRSGYRTLAAGDGAEALALYVAHRSEVAVVLTDQQMPGMDGRAEIRALRQINPEVKIILMSGQLSEPGAVAPELHALGVKKILSKPFTAAELLHAVREA